MKASSMWKSLGCALFFMFLLVFCQSQQVAEECLKRQKNLAILDLTTDTLSKAKREIPDCKGGENGTHTNASDCSQKAEIFALLDIAQDFVADVKANYSSCTRSEKTETPPIPCPQPIDCSQILKNGLNTSGVYTVYPRSRVSCNEPMEVYCDMETDGGGWTVIQRRGNFRIQENFARNWNDYKNGFGNITQDFWIGNDNIYRLSNQGCFEIRFDLEDVQSNRTFATYDTFWIDDERLNYTLHINGFKGNAGDAMEYHNNQQFGTIERPNVPYRNCAEERGRGGWWYNGCTESNLNGLYKRDSKDRTGVFWRKWKDYESLGASEIKLRPRQILEQIQET